jgi:hypothetical protein
MPHRIRIGVRETGAVRRDPLRCPALEGLIVTTAVVVPW